MCGCGTTRVDFIAVGLIETAGSVRRVDMRLDKRLRADEQHLDLGCLFADFPVQRAVGIRKA